MLPSLQLYYELTLALVISCSLAGCKTRLLEPRVETPDASAVMDAGPPDLTGVICMPGPILASHATPTLMFVLDRSGSMGQGFGPFGNRWQSLTRGLSMALPPVDMTMLMGALMFPSGTGQSCSVPGSPNITPALGNANAIINLMRNTSPAGSTPTSDAMNGAAKQLLAVRAAASARALVLATDGAPTCNSMLDPATCVCASGAPGTRCSTASRCLDDARTVETIEALAQKGLPTYVVGIQSAANPQFIAVLNDMALAGGRPRGGTGDRFYAANSDAELASALVAIRDQVSDCEYLLSNIPPLGEVMISVAGVVIPHDPSGMNGWVWRDQANGEIAIVGDACRDAVAAGVSIDAEIVCPPGG